MNTLNVFCVYFLHLLNCGETSNLALELLTSLHEEYCGDTRFCDGNSVSTSSNHLTPFRSCCYSCSCSEDCHSYGNCCPQDLNNVTSVQNNKYYRDKTKFTCLTPQLIPNRLTSLMGNSYYMINTCPVSFLDAGTRMHCGVILWRWKSLSELVPVYMTDRHAMYKNIHCATCNSAKHILYLDTLVKCERNDVHSVIGLAGPEDIFSYLQDSNKPLCNIIFKIPKHPKIQQRDSLECVRTDVSSCNSTGSWENYDPVLNRACNSFYSPVQARIPRDRYDKVFKNMACYKCNNRDRLNRKSPLCSKMHQTNTDVVELTLNFDPTLAQPEPIRSSYSLNTESGMACETGFFLDPYTNLCRAEECPLDQYKKEGRCVSTFKEISTFNLHVALKMFLNRRDIMMTGEKAEINPAYQDAIVNAFARAYRICNMTIWLKLGKKPFIVLDIALHEENASSLYETTLNQFMLVYETPGLHVHFADHILFDRAKNSAVDLRDDVELSDLNTTYFQHSDCGFPLSVTETRFCPRVKLDVANYTLLNNKIFLEHTLSYAYGGEYFIDRFGNVYLCINRYLNNSTIGYINNGTISTIDTNKREEQKTIEDNNETSLITKDFGFFIGCLALVVVFVLIFLAKKQYSRTLTSPPEQLSA